MNSSSERIPSAFKTARLRSSFSSEVAVGAGGDFAAFCSSRWCNESAMPGLASRPEVFARRLRLKSLTKRANAIASATIACVQFSMGSRSARRSAVAPNASNNTATTIRQDELDVRCVVIRLTKHKISDDWRGRAWLRIRGCSYHKLDIRAASGSLHRLVRRGDVVHAKSATVSGVCVEAKIKFFKRVVARNS